MPCSHLLHRFKCSACCGTESAGIKRNPTLISGEESQVMCNLCKFCQNYKVLPGGSVYLDAKPFLRSGVPPTISFNLLLGPAGGFGTISGDYKTHLVLLTGI